MPTFFPGTQGDPFLFPQNVTPSYVLVGWYDFSDASTVWADTSRTVPITNGTAIAGVTDKSGAGNHLSQATSGNRPVWVNGVQAGRAIGRFTAASTQFLSTATSPSLPKGTAPLVAFVVAKAGTGNQRILGFGSSAGWSWGAQATVGRMTTNSVLDYDFAAQFGNPDSTFNIHTAVLDGSQDVTWFKNGIASGTVNGTVFGNDPGTAAVNIGARDSSLDPWNGDIGEILIYQGAADVGAGVAVLTAKWFGLAVNVFQHAAANITFTGGTHLTVVTRSLTHTKANITFTGGTHSTPVGRSLTETKANLTFTGGTHSTAVTRILIETKANISFAGGAHSLVAAHSLTETKANITFTGGSHTLVATHALTTAKANITFTGGIHALSAGRSLVHVKANITLAGGAHSLTAGRSLTHVKANITFIGGSHTLTPSTGTHNFTLTTVAPNLTLTGGQHTLSFLPFGTTNEPGQWHHAYRTEDHFLEHLAPRMRFRGGRHGFEKGRDPEIEDEEVLVLV